MRRKTKTLAVPEHKEIDEKKFNEFIEKNFKKSMQMTRTDRYKVFMKHIAKFNSDNFGSVKSLAETI